ncbi:uncharacterized protein LOC110711457 isoform X1 [Chenopodium quinoa]|uniref:DUF4378 domain-containing protein n=2 Tax=Chenopodium quinoa TaxID=63459 RepID=A0A803N5W5_CHEQI|nr:uncharacterized protein LOC110711457 isoform X1 [Chenopodium quinoa]
MDRFRRRRPHARVSSPSVNVSTIVDRGNQLVGKQNRSPNSGSHSGSCSSIATSELLFDLGRGSGGLSTGTTMKKLLADEMSKETEFGRRSPSIIARLMGLDGLPTPHNTNKKQKRQSDSHQRGSNSAGFSKNGKLHDSRSHRKNVTGQQPFKDVYEVVDGLNMEIRSNTFHAASNRTSCEDEISFIRQKFMDVKRFSTDENLQHSKEYHDALDVLDSNKDLLLKIFQEPDSLFSKHLHDLHDSPESYIRCVLGMNSKNALKCNINVIGCQTTGEASQKIDIRHSHKHSASCYGNMYTPHSTDLHNSSFSGGNEDTSSNPTKIVVLKPNLCKSLNITKSASSTSTCEPQSDFNLYNECSNVKHLGPEVRCKGSKHGDSYNYGRKSRESRELAREITRRMRNKLGADSFTVSSSGCNGYKGYSADESSHDTSENDSSDESEVTFASSRTSSNRIVPNKASSLRYMESSVNIEAKKRLSERWKMTHRSQEHGASSKGSTLADMLAIPDVDIRPQSPDIVVPQDEHLQTSGRNDKTAKLNSPLGISSRDGWKDGCVQKLSRSRSLPSSINHLGSPKSNSRNEAITAERFLIRKESVDHMRNKSIKRNSRRKGVSFSDSRKPNNEKFESVDVKVDMVDDIHKVQCSGNMINITTDEKDSPDVKTVILEVPSSRNDSRLALVEKEKNNVYDEPATASPSCNIPEDGSSTNDMPSLPQVGDSSCLQCAATHADSPANSKESEQPSPVSILEAPFVEDVSSGSECFERVSAELHGLRKQLQLLKLESEGYNEGSLVVSSDEYGEDSTELHDGKHFPQVGECWESWYLVDVLTLSGLNKTDSELFHGTWHSPDCPIDPWVFEDLEKRYGELESCSRSERRLLFDHINARIVEISEQIVDLESWTMTSRKNIGPQWLKDVLKTELHKLLEKQENKVAENAIDMLILSDMRWMKLGEHISAVGRDIEVLLIDELIAESIIG